MSNFQIVALAHCQTVFTEAKPAPVLGGSGAGSVVVNRNAGPWRAIAEFLDAQHLASFGLRRLTASESAERRKGPACGMGPAPRACAPLGNHGDNTYEVAA